MKAIICLFAILLSATLAFAAPNQDEIRFEITEAANPAEAQDLLDELEFVEAEDALAEEAANIGDIVNIAKMIWKIIEANKPVVDVAYDYANALPREGRVEGFSPLQMTSYQMTGKNYLNKEIFRITFSVVHRFGGNVEGVGRYIETAAVIPTNVAVFWGYTFEMKMANVKVSNIGTHKAPVAAMVMEVACTVKTVIKEVQHRKVFEIRGDSAEVRLLK